MKQVSKILLCLAVSVYSFDTMAKLSSNSVKNQVANIEDALSKCNFSANVLNEIKSKTVGGAVSSGVATIGSGVATTTSIIAAVKSSNHINGKDYSTTKSKKDKSTGETGTTQGGTQPQVQTPGDNGTKLKKYDTSTEENRNSVKQINSSLKNLRVASAIASGVATGANLVTVTLSGTSVSQLGKLMDDADDCEGALNSITISEK